MKKYCFHMPWEWKWVRTSNLRKDGNWEHETNKDRKSFWDIDKWKDVLWTETHPYTYILKRARVQERLATIKVEEREWRWRGMQWNPYLKRVKKTINVEFNDEVGEQSGSWKGGTLGCSYTMLKGETPWQTLKRMEIERTFR